MIKSILSHYPNPWILVGVVCLIIPSLYLFVSWINGLDLSGKRIWKAVDKAMILMLVVGIFIVLQG